MGYMARIFDVPAYFRMQSRCESPVSRPFVLASRWMTTLSRATTAPSC